MLLSVPGSSAGQMDAGSRRVYDEAFCRHVRDEVCGDGVSRSRGRKTVGDIAIKERERTV